MFNQKLQGIKFEGAIMNASGVKDTETNELIKIAKSRSCAIVTKTATYSPREGNPKPRYYEGIDKTINSMGLPNPGYAVMAERIKALKKQTNKPIFGSLRLIEKKEAYWMIKSYEQQNVEVIEVNLSTPNALGKYQLCYDFEKCDEILKNVRKIVKTPIAIKVSPFLDGMQQLDFIDMIKKYKPNFIVAVNSPGNALMIDPHTKKILLKPKWGGYGGRGIKPIALGNIRRYYEELGKKTTIVGCGGIFTELDAFEHILAGASLVSIGSVFAINGPKIFEEIENRLERTLKSLDYSSISEAIGQAKEVE